ncbi:aspartate/glutamate racemase family protein [Xanthobacteraceae bacterium A53D]
MTRPEIVVVNPNSNAVVTAGFDAALAPLRFADGPTIRCITLEDGPYGVETQEHVEQVALPLRRMVERESAAAAFVIACYSDPGLHICREGTKAPVFGIAECALTTALTRGDRFGVIAIGEGSMPRHQRYVRQMGLMERFAGERPLNMSVAESASGENTLSRMIEIGGELVKLDRCDVIVMGCAGMARHRKALEAALGVPVIDPVQAAVTMAIGAVSVA